MLLVGHLQAQDYRIQYDSIVRLFVLPKANTPQTLVVVSLDPPIRKGQTYYPHILCQFSNDEELSVELELTEEQLAAKNERVSVPLCAHHTASQDVMLAQPALQRHRHTHLCALDCVARRAKGPSLGQRTVVCAKLHGHIANCLAAESRPPSAAQMSWGSAWVQQSLSRSCCVCSVGASCRPACLARRTMCLPRLSGAWALPS